MTKKYKRYTITAALPYANGEIHIGHLAGVYIPADIYVRYLRAKSRDVVFVCGSDENGVAIEIRARKEKKQPQEIVDFYHQRIQSSFEKLGIDFDIYHRTSSPLHHRTASEFFKKLYDTKKLIEDTSEQYYDAHAHQFLADRYIMGTCPICDFEEAYGDQCEHCGSTLSPSELKKPKSMLSGTAPIMKQTQHWYLPLNKYERWLKEWILEKHKDWKNNVYGQCKSWLKQGLKPRPITRDLSWGIPVPIPGVAQKVLYVWFDAPIGYISATKEWAEKNNKNWEHYWKSADTKLVHFIGKDNIVFHCIIFPVLLKAEGTYILPDNVPANEFLNLEGGKISTSRNRAVWLHEYLTHFPNKQDVLRYTLIANAPETKDNDFTWSDFQAKNNNELVAIFGNFIHRTLILTHKYFDGKVPQKDEEFPIDSQLSDQIKDTILKIEELIEKYKFREALSNFIDMARAGNKYLADTEPWKKIAKYPTRTATILNNALQIVANLAILSIPFLPHTGKKLKNMLNINNYTWDMTGNKQIIEQGHVLNLPELLFEKIDDETIQKQIDKLPQ